jgi:UDP-N-acetylmuramate dehydrogenase
MTLADFPVIERTVPLAGFSTFGVGGPANYFYALKDLANLGTLVAAAHLEKIPIFVLGGGSNVLFADEGFCGLVVRVVAEDVRVEGDQIMAEAGAKWPRILEAAEKIHLNGFEAMAGLPGTVGGAVTGNAGCFGVEMKDMLVKAEIYDLASNTVRTVTPEFFQYRYRWSRLKEEPAVVLRVWLKGASVPANAPTSKEIQALRQTKQPPGKTGGSFFKNPFVENNAPLVAGSPCESRLNSAGAPGLQPAGWLIDQCGLKGLKIGGAQISPKHGNFFMNVGGATTNDLLALRDRAKAAVRNRFGIELKEEVVIVGIMVIGRDV